MTLDACCLGETSLVYADGDTAGGSRCRSHEAASGAAVNVSHRNMAGSAGPLSMTKYERLAYLNEGTVAEVAAVVFREEGPRGTGRPPAHLAGSRAGAGQNRVR